MEIERLGGLAMSGMLSHVETRTPLERPTTSTFFFLPLQRYVKFIAPLASFPLPAGRGV